MKQSEKILSKMKFLRSFRLRILIIMVLMGIIPSLVIRYGVLQTYTQRAITLRESDVQTQGKILANHLATTNYLQDPSSGIVKAELEQFSELYDGRILIVDNNFRVVGDTYGISDGKTMILEEIIKCFRGENTINYDKTNQFIEMTIPIVQTLSQDPESVGGYTDTTQEQVITGVLLISVSTENIKVTLSVLKRNVAIIGALMIVAIIGISLWIAYIVARPFQHVTDEIQRLKTGVQDKRIAVPDYIETERIAQAFNELYGRMQVLNESREEFVSNVSHELKTPMTSMKVLADSLLMQEEVPAELYREFLVDVADEIDRENKIINDLLALVKMDRKHADMNIMSTDINAMLELIMKRLRPIAMKGDVEMTLECIRPVVADIDEVKITLAITNLVENAIKYNTEHGWVKVKLDSDHQFFTVEVSDSGIGIPQEAREHIYERFYRVDKSHSREIGGTGLGLAITQNAILMHKGTIQMDSEPGNGTIFTVKIPLVYLK